MLNIKKKFQLMKIGSKNFNDANSDIKVQRKFSMPLVISVKLVLSSIAPFLR